MARDARIGFQAAGVQAARVDSELYEAGDPRRAAAYMALGASGSVAARPSLEQFAVEGQRDDRIAAILSLGELGDGIGPALDRLIGLVAAEGGEIREAALVALARSGQRRGRDELRRLGAARGALGVAAKAVMDHAIDPERAPLPDAWRLLYDLRWEAARSYGTVDGRPWRVVRIEELSTDEKFLEALVLTLVPTLRNPLARDHVLALLMEGSGPARVQAGVRYMPDEVDRLVREGLWRPSNALEWFKLVEIALVDELWPRLGAALTQSESVVRVRPIVAALEHSYGTRYEELLGQALESNQVFDRANAAFAIGAAGLTDYAANVRRLGEDPEPWVRAAAWVALLRMAERAGITSLDELFETPRERRAPRITEFVFEFIERAAPDLDVLDYLTRSLNALGSEDALEAQAILALHGRRADTELLRSALPGLSPVSQTTVRVVRALGEVQGEEDLKAIAAAFPFDGAPTTDVAAAAALVRGRHRSVDRLLEAAIWRLPRNESILAAGLVYETRGARVLREWLLSPPVDVTEAHVRRVGYALGLWGGQEAFEDLERELGPVGGSSEPALQGAYFGMFASRTR